MNETIQYVLLSDWFPSCSITFSKFIHAVTWIRTSSFFFFMENNIPLYGYTTFYLSIH